MIRLAIFASGNGTNAENIIRYFSGHSLISVSLVISNNSSAKVLQKAERHKVPTAVFTKLEWSSPTNIITILDKYQIDYIILAGFLLKISSEIIKLYSDKILNIHPALLPDYGGKGMYGMNVHKAVLANKEPRSGISIHLVNEEYDEGAVLFQAECEINKDETPETLAKKVHALEYRYYPRVIERYIFPSGTVKGQKGVTKKPPH